MYCENKSIYCDRKSVGRRSPSEISLLRICILFASLKFRGEILAACGQTSLFFCQTPQAQAIARTNRVVSIVTQ
ncbi:MAG: hypothetical protein ACYTXC_27065 [Nostoc sp.]